MKKLSKCVLVMMEDVKLLLRTIFNEVSAEGVLLVDATNASTDKPLFTTSVYFAHHFAHHLHKSSTIHTNLQQG